MQKFEEKIVSEEATGCYRRRQKRLNIVMNISKIVWDKH